MLGLCRITCTWILLLASAQACELTLRVPVNDVLGQRAPEAAMRSVDDRWLDAIAAEANICIRPVGEPANIPRRQKMLADGEADVATGASKTPEREGYAWFSQPYREELIYFLARKSDARMRAGPATVREAAEKNYRMAVFRGAWIGAEFDQIKPLLLRQQKLFEFDNNAQGLAMLQHQRIDLMLVADQSLAPWRDPALNLQTLPAIVYRGPVHLMLSRKSGNEELLNQLNAAIARLLARGFQPQ